MTEMTPEKLENATPEKLENATPENLAKLARLIRMGQPLQAIAVGEVIDLCVAAWKADRKTLELERRVSNERGRCAIERQSRIEALEELVSAERDLPLRIEPDYEDSKYPEKHERAALARKRANMPLSRP